MSLTLPLIVGAGGFLGIEHFAPPWDVFFLPLFNLLVLAYRILFSDFALAIIVFTVVIRTLLAPLFVRQIRSQREMQRMQPLVREVQRKHKGNRQKISEETMALYREHGVNPAAGCVPLLLQLPLLFALYQALIRASNVVTVPAQLAASDTFSQLQAALPGIERLREQNGNVLFKAPFQGSGDVCNLAQFTQGSDAGTFSHFLPLNCQLIDPLKLSEPIKTTVDWLLGLDLAQQDRTFALVLGNPETGFGISAIAVLAAVLQFVQVKMTSPRPNPDDPTAATSSTMIYLFPLLTIFWGGLFPSGLILYWAIYTGYLLGHQYLMMGWGNLFPIFGWQPSWAPAPPGAGSPARRIPADSGNTTRIAADKGTAAERSTGVQPSASGTPSQSSPSRTGSGQGAGRQQPRRSQKRRRGRRR